jgi:hypothetical protein
VLPAGNLGNTSAFGKALVEAHQLGLISRVPRLPKLGETMVGHSFHPVYGGKGAESLFGALNAYGYVCTCHV